MCNGKRERRRRAGERRPVGSEQRRISIESKAGKTRKGGRGEGKSLMQEKQSQEELNFGPPAWQLQGFKL